MYFLQSKDQALSKFKQFKALVENHTGRKIKSMRTDRGGEYLGEDFKTFLAEHGIKAQRTAPYTPQQNGVAERANRTIMESARAMLHAKSLPPSLWAEAVATAVNLKNISPTKALPTMTPSEAWHGRLPNGTFLKVFGCKAYAHIPSANRSKLQPKSKECIFTGYDMDSKAYRLYDPRTMSIIISRDVVFDESSHMERNPASKDQEPFPVMVPAICDSSTSVQAPLQDEDVPAVGDEEQPQEEVPEVDDPEGQKPQEESPPPLRRSTRERRPPQKYWIANPAERACVASFVEPTTYKEAVTGPDAKQWEQAMTNEYNSIMENGTWELVQLPAGRKAVGCKWVYKLKRDAAGNIKTWKARLVARGFSQVEGLDFTETFAPVAKFTSIRILLSLAAAHDWECHHMDVKTAFLNGELEEEIYMEQPKGFIKPGEEHLVCKLKKSLYGLKQSPRAWNKKLHEQLNKAGFTRCEADHSVYYSLKDDGAHVFLLVYVDDLIILANLLSALQSCKDSLNKSFKMTDLGEASHFLGMEISRDRAARTLSIHQGSYIKTVLDRFGMADCAPLSIPLAVGTKFPPLAEKESSFMLQYQKLVGSLMYLMVATRPDLAFAVGAVSQFMSSPGEEHLAAVKRIMRYIKETQEYKLTLGAGVKGKVKLVGYSDADWGANDINRRSISGYTFLLGAGAVSWCSKKQASVALSSTESEYMALTQAAKEAIWIKRLLTEIGYMESDDLVIHVDNQGCMALAHNPEFHARTKHIDIQYHFIREKVDEGVIQLQYCPTKEMVADVLTKPVPAEKHKWCTKACGVGATA